MGDNKCPVPKGSGCELCSFLGKIGLVWFRNHVLPRRYFIETVVIEDTLHMWVKMWIRPVQRAIRSSRSTRSLWFAYSVVSDGSPVPGGLDVGCGFQRVSDQVVYTPANPTKKNRLGKVLFGPSPFSHGNVTFSWLVFVPAVAGTN